MYLDHPRTQPKTFLAHCVHAWHANERHHLYTLPQGSLIQQRFVQQAAVLARIFLTLLLSSLHRASHVDHPRHFTGLGSVAVARPPKDACRLNSSTLHQYGLSHTVQYARRHITTPVTDSYESPNLVDVDEALVPLLQRPLALPLPIPPPTHPEADLSMLLGVTTAAERLHDSISHIQLSMQQGTRIHLLVVLVDEAPVEVLQEELQAAGINATVQLTDRTWREAWFEMVPLVHEEVEKRRSSDSPVQWVGLIDDDTFFPSMTNLMNMLRKYDFTRPHYVGSLIGDWEVVAANGMLASGGAGVVLSIPLLDELTEAFPICRDSLQAIPEGDQRLRRCILDNTQTSLSPEKELPQPETIADARGVFESGRPMLSIHHWKSTFTLDVVKLYAAARWKFFAVNQTRNQPPVVLTNGYSIVEYHVPELPNFDKTEMTWVGSGKDRSLTDDANFRYGHSLASMRPPLKEGAEKRSDLLADTVTEPDGHIRQVYIRRGSDSNENGTDEDAVIEPIWLNEA
ncbi:MAG: hypothetical protein M1838_005917 [Thelocarpon superellum]|nr:MAG: hypothetical protein M1838_005917 [Thelocarpon superellum]